MIPKVLRICATAVISTLGVLATAACGGGSGESKIGTTGSALVEAKTDGGSSATRPIFIANDRGIEEIGISGKVVRRISPTPARRPRLTGDGHLVFMAKGFAELRRVKLDGTGERPLAVVPPTVASSCEMVFPKPWDPALLLRADSAMQVDAQGAAVCLHLTHGDENESSAWVRIDLPKSGRGRGTLGLVCGADPPPTDFQCKEREDERGARPAGTYEVRKRAIVKSGSDQPVRALTRGTLSEVAWSPSSPWSLIVAAVKKGNFMHRHVLALDRKSGDVYEIGTGSWPEPMSDKRWQALDKGKDVSQSVALKSDIRALGHDGLFVVDTLLVAPGRQVIDARGQFAQ